VFFLPHVCFELLPRSSARRQKNDKKVTYVFTERFLTLDGSGGRLQHLPTRVGISFFLFFFLK
jgi:hypothetical protein